LPRAAKGAYTGWKVEPMLKPKHHTARKNKKITLVLDVKEYDRMMADLEELDSIRAYDAAVNSGETPIPFERAIREIERSGK
jgi:hypothetical protein